MSILRISLLLALVASASDLRAERSVEDEYKALLWKTAKIIHEYYVEEVPPDSLVQAAARGIFNALDPASEYTFNARAQFDGETTTRQLNHRFYTLMRIAQAIDEKAFYPVAADTLIRFGIAGMMEILDPYSVFLEKRNLDNFNIQTQGKYGGLGFRIQVVYPDSAIAVWSLVHDQTPAALAGVKSGDLITAINNTSTKGMSAGVAADSMRGEPGTSVTLTLERADRPTPFDLTIERQEVQMNSVSLATLFPDSTGYINLGSFQKGSSREMFRAIVELEEQGMQRMIFDLRNNGGGYLEEAVQIADLFLPRGHLVAFTEGRAIKTDEYLTRENALLHDTPLIVLVNHQSASASEIVAGAIQDWDRGLVLGTTTVGKGSVQQIVHIDDRAELKLTMAAWHTPSGRSIDKRMRKDSTLVRGYDKAFKTLRLERIVRGGGGISPDIEVPGRSGSRLYGLLKGFYSLNNQFFYYAREHRLKYPGLTPDFVVGPEDLAAFRTFAENRGFDYISELEAQAEELDKVAEGEEYNQLAKTLGQLTDEIDTIEEKHWQENEELIAWQLTFDILEKAFGEQVAEAYNVTVDPQVLEARRIIADPSEYQMWFDKREIGMPEEDSIAQEDGSGDLQ
ncbi:MAG: S41 family peptidase [Gemmatimonadota bacterium]|nr:S41 family peptidase [Gemmatimonadota bacterium]